MTAPGGPPAVRGRAAARAAPAARGGAGGPQAPDRTLYVGNLPYDATQRRGRDAHQRRRAPDSVVRVHLPMDADGRKRGFGFVTMASAETAKTAAEALRDGRPPRSAPRREPRASRRASARARPEGGGGGGGFGGGGFAGGGRRVGGGGGRGGPPPPQASAATERRKRHVRATADGAARSNARRHDERGGAAAAAIDYDNDDDWTSDDKDVAIGGPSAPPSVRPRAWPRLPRA